MDVAALEQLAQAPMLSSVRHLDLSRNAFGSRGFAALCASPYLTHLETLELAGSTLGEPGATALTMR